MCVPILGAVVGLAGAAVSAAGAKQQAEGEAQRDEYNAKVAKINGIRAMREGLVESDKVAAKYDRQFSQQRAGYAKAGVLPSGSAAQVVDQEGGANKWMDEMTTIWNRETEKVGNENKAKDLEAQAANKRQAGKIAATSSILSGLGGVAKAGSSLVIG